MASVVGRNPPWLAKVAVKVTDAVHGEHRMLFHRPLPPEGTVRVRNRLGGVVDKGPGRGALIHVEQEIADATSRAVACTETQTSFIRAAGGFRGPSGPSPAPHTMPPRPPDIVDDFTTLAQSALLYRLSGDRNPLHSEPDVARAAGFPRPILRGLATYGMVGWRIIRTLAGGDPRRLAALGHAVLRTRPARRDPSNRVVVSNGRAVLRD